MKYRFVTGYQILLTCLLCVFVWAPLASAVTESQNTESIPWSGYWWPYNGCGLGTGQDYYGHPSPLEKYDQYISGYYPGPSTMWYTNQFCSEVHPYWYGHCGHWALAASTENYDILPSSNNNIIFRVGDKKGLLTLMHSDDIAIWGNGSQPAEFHLWLLKYIKDEKKAFIADIEAGEEVWQYPIYRYDMTSTIDDRVESVTVDIYYADDFVHPDFIGTEEEFQRYTYNLFLGPDNEITGGEWTEDSVVAHPEQLYFSLSAGSQVPDANYDLVRQIAQSKDDELENGHTPVAIAPGTFNLVLMDEDTYTLFADPGDLLTLDIMLLDGGGDQAEVTVYDSKDLMIDSYALTDVTSASIRISAQNPPYRVVVSKDQYDIPGIYQVVYDQYATNSVTIPYIPKDGPWSGFSITNYSTEPMKNVTFTTYSSDGRPIHTLLGPLELAPGEKRKFTFSSLPARQHELSEVLYARISSSGPIGPVNLIGIDDGVASLTQGHYKGHHIALPDSVEEYQADKRMFGYIINEGSQDAAITATVYSSAAKIFKTTPITLGARQSYYFAPGRTPFSSMPDNGWIEIKGKNGDEEISAFQYMTKGTTLETNFAVPVTSDIQVIPHIPFSEKWNSELVLINHGTASAAVVIHRKMAGTDTTTDLTVNMAPKTKQVISLDAYFEGSSSDPYYRSIVTVTSTADISGYYAYHSVSYTDNVTIPLMVDADYGSTLLLPHNTQGGDWWTGIGIFNPGETAVTVIMEAYENFGQQLGVTPDPVTLAPGQYVVYNNAMLFAGESQNISHILFKTNDPAKRIGGFYLYGSQTKGMCGANLQPIDNE